MVIEMVDSIPSWSIYLGLIALFAKFAWNLKDREIAGIDKDPREATGTSGWGEGGE
jgi:hypothetical protein